MQHLLEKENQKSQYITEDPLIYPLSLNYFFY